MGRIVSALIAAISIVGPAFAADAPKIDSKKDVIYGALEGSGLLADLAWPDGKDQMPVVMIVHGGRWRAGSKNDAGYAKQEIFAAAGFFTMNIDYRLVNATPAPGCYQDLYTAIRWVHAHAAEYHLDTNRIYLIGNSSGGHEVALAATLGQGPYPRTGGWDDADSGIAGVISYSGAYDLTTLSWGNLWTPLTGDAKIGFTTLGGSAVEEARRTASPLFHISATTKPILLIHSEDDRSVPFQQAVEMDKALTAAHVHHKFIQYKDHGHMSFSDDNIQAALSFIADLEARK